MDGSILNDVKKVLGMPADYTAFDVDVIMHINSALGTLNQLGIGPAVGFQIEDDTAMWSDFIPDDPRYNDVKGYLYMKSRLRFDPPSTSFHLKALQDQILETEVRLNMIREQDMWVPVTETPAIPDNPIMDGGTP